MFILLLKKIFKRKVKKMNKKQIDLLPGRSFRRVCSVRVSALLLIGIIVLLAGGCAKTVEPVPDAEPKKYVTDISIEDVTLSEVWLNLNLTQTLPKSQLVILANDNEVHTGEYSYGKKLIKLQELNAGTPYELEFLVKDSLENCIDSSAVFQFETIDQKAFNFKISRIFIPAPAEFQAVELRSIAILDENHFFTVGDLRKDTGNIYWAVYSGLEYINGSLNLMQIDDFIGDSTEINPFPYNAAERINNKIYITDGSNIIVNTGTDWQKIISFFHLNIPGIKHLWGNSANNIYLAGNEGTFARYDGSQFERINTGTVTDIVDLWGSEKYNYVWFCTYEYDGDGKSFTSKVYQYDGETVEIIIDCNDIEGMRYVRSIWSYGRRLYLAGDKGFYHYDFLDEKAVIKTGEIRDIYEIRKIRGINHNTIYGVGTVGVVYSFDGANWKFETGWSLSTIYFDLDIIDNKVIAAGISGHDYKIGIYTF